MIEESRQTELIWPDWPAPPQVRAVSTTRRLGESGGASLPPFDSFNLADHVDDESRAVAANREQLTQNLNLPSQPHWLHQVHGTGVVALNESTANNPEADASIAFTPHQICAVLTADCLPVLFCDREGTRVAAAHTGWRGLAAGVLDMTLSTLAVDPAQVLVWLGPAIGPQAFEVGDEVRQQFLAFDSKAAQAFVPAAPKNGQPHWLGDLYLLARQRLQQTGVQAIYGGGLCTFTESQRFFSYRRSGETGRMATLIWLTDG